MIYLNYKKLNRLNNFHTNVTQKLIYINIFFYYVNIQKQ